jgi:MtN3 and saliva related transmembrane protein
MTALLGTVAALLTTGCWVPQVIRTVRTRSARDFSWAYLVAFGAGVLGWLGYGVLRRDPAIILANFLTVAGLGVITWIKFVTGRRGAARVTVDQ